MNVIGVYVDDVSGVEHMLLITLHHNAFTFQNVDFVLVVVLMAWRMPTWLDFEHPHGEILSVYVGPDQPSHFRIRGTFHVDIF